MTPIGILKTLVKILVKLKVKKSYTLIKAKMSSAKFACYCLNTLN